MEADSMAAEYSLIWKDHTQHVRESFTKLLENNDHCDVTLYTEGQRVAAHKILLSACSEYFNRLFVELKEERPVIVLKGVQFDILQHILRFIYHGEVSIEIDRLNDFLETAEFLKIFGLIRANSSAKRSRTSPPKETDNACNTEDVQLCKCGETEVLTHNLEGPHIGEGEVKNVERTNSKTSSASETSNASTRKKKESPQKLYRIDIMSVQEVVPSDVLEREDENDSLEEENMDERFRLSSGSEDPFVEVTMQKENVLPIQHCACGLETNEISLDTSSRRSSSGSIKINIQGSIKSNGSAQRSSDSRRSSQSSKASTRRTSLESGSIRSLQGSIRSDRSLLSQRTKSDSSSDSHSSGFRGNQKDKMRLNKSERLSGSLDEIKEVLSNDSRMDYEGSLDGDSD